MCRPLRLPTATGRGCNAFVRAGHDQLAWQDAPEREFLTELILRLLAGEISPDESNRWINAIDQQMEASGRRHHRGGRGDRHLLVDDGVRGDLYLPELHLLDLAVAREAPARRQAAVPPGRLPKREWDQAHRVVWGRSGGPGDGFGRHLPRVGER